jgi:hypothetical protein
MERQVSAWTEVGALAPAVAARQSNLTTDIKVRYRRDAVLLAA